MTITRSEALDLALRDRLPQSYADVDLAVYAAQAYYTFINDDDNDDAPKTLLDFVLSVYDSNVDEYFDHKIKLVKDVRHGAQQYPHLLNEENSTRDSSVDPWNLTLRAAAQAANEAYAIRQASRGRVNNA